MAPPARSTWPVLGGNGPVTGGALLLWHTAGLQANNDAQKLAESFRENSVRLWIQVGLLCTAGAAQLGRRPSFFIPHRTKQCSSLLIYTIIWKQQPGVGAGAHLSGYSSAEVPFWEQHTWQARQKQKKSFWGAQRHSKGLLKKCWILVGHGRNIYKISLYSVFIVCQFLGIWLKHELFF